LFRAGFRDELFRDDFLGIETSARAKMVAMRFAVLLITFLGSTLVLACSGDDKTGARTPEPEATRAATTTVEPAASATPGVGAAVRGITGLFTDPRPSQPDDYFTLPPRPLSPFKDWDGKSVVVYDIENMTGVNFGPGLGPSISPDGTRLAFNVLEQAKPSRVRIIDLATRETIQEFESTGGLASFIDDNYLYVPSSGMPQVRDIRSGETTPLEKIGDPLLRARLEQRAYATSSVVNDGQYRLAREGFDEEQDKCLTKPDPAMSQNLCEADRAEHWTLREVRTGSVVLQFQAYDAGPAGPGEIVLATSPQCDMPDGTTAWCPKVSEILRSDDPSDTHPYEEVRGSSNIFIVEIESGEAQFVATADFSAVTQYGWPQNWPLIADKDYVVWTGSYCSQESPANTRIYDRATGKIAELDASLWVQFTPTGDLGVDPFGPDAILNIDTLDWKIVLPDNVGDVGESPDGRYLYVGGVLGHGGLC
jgi:WD40-like Beta Propeller Repeat